MCIIAVKKSGVEMPSDGIIRNMFINNPDGAGFMYHDKNKDLVIIKKGYMTLDSFLIDINKINDIKNTAVIMHFRITTHGGTKPENCHPFPISENIGMLQKLDVKTKIGVVHNGIISSVLPNKNESDTMCYIREQLAPLSKALPKFYENEHAILMVKNAIGSKMSFLTHEGKIITIGDFVEDNYILYSNYSFESWGNYKCKPKAIGFAEDYKLLSYEDGYIKEILVSEHILSDSLVVDVDGFPIEDISEIFVDQKGNIYYYDYEIDMLSDLRLYDYALFGTVPKFNYEASFYMYADVC